MNGVVTMFLEVFTNQALAANGTVYSQAFDIGADNAFFLAAFAVSGTTTVNSLSLNAEGSNDLINWVPLTTGGALVLSTAAPVAGGANVTDVAARYVRIKADAGTSGAITFNASINSKQL